MAKDGAGLFFYRSERKSVLFLLLDLASAVKSRQQKVEAAKTNKSARHLIGSEMSQSRERRKNIFDNIVT